MSCSVSEIVPEKHFEIVGISYIGAPRSHTAMFITKKVEHLLSALDSVEECLVFAESGIVVTEGLLKKHAFHFSSRPQAAYAEFANQFAEQKFLEESKLKYNLTSGGYYVSEDVSIPEDAYIETGCQIGPDVQIGKRARILKGAVIRHATIGDYFLANEYAVIGSNGFTMAENDEKNKIRIPTLGRVVIGDHVEVGTHNNISRGSGEDTVIEEHVKLDTLVQVGHDDHICRNVELAAGTILGGFAVVGEGTFTGINSTVKNRIEIGKSAFISMGAVVMREVPENVTVVGYPARALPQEQK